MQAARTEALEHAAAGGDAEAMHRLGLLLLGSAASRADAPRGAGWLKAAAERGHGEACARWAVLAALGVCRPQGWTQAFDDLQRAAELGWLPAQRTLLLLAAECVSAAGTDWRQARRQIDVETLLRLPPKQPLAERPRIRRFERFVSEAMCHWLIDSARGRLERARLYDAQTGQGIASQTRTNTEADFELEQTDIVLALLRARMAAATGLPTEMMELTKVLHYEPGQAFAPHFDFIDPALPGLAKELQTRGQRLVTFLVYLNDDYEGGETEFLHLGLRHRGRRGDALMFANVDPSGQVDRQTLHAGRPPLSGQKWLLSQWIRDRVPLQA